MSKLNLDDLFKEKFKDFSEVPDEKVWETISASLDKRKNKRRVIPIWWKLGGIAAALAVLIYAVDPFGVPSENLPNVSTVDKPNDIVPMQSQDKEGIKEEVIDIQDTEESIATSDTEVELESPEVTSPKTNDSKPNHESGISQTKRNPVVSKKPKANLVHNENNNRLQNVKDVNGSSSTIHTNEQEAVAVQEKTHENNKAQEYNDATLKTDSKTASEIAIQKTQLDVLDESENEGSVKKSIFDEIESTEELTEVSNPSERWSVGANVAPVYFNSFGEGSPVHSSFVPNTKSGEVNLSYGLTVAYALNKKLSIRSGINKVDYGYDTNEIEFATALGTSNALTNNSYGKIETIDYTTRSQNLIVTSNAGPAIPQKESFAASDVAGKPTSREGALAQQFGYIEVPVELDYALIDKRLGFNLIGGFSSLFLIDNSISLNSGDLTTEIGKANNINSVNFSGNFGFGVNYKLSSNLRLNVEPVLKYQLNTFSGGWGDFQPFSVGVYSGLHFKF
ncbi:MAG: hypothetical protein WBM83_11365 [Flavobacteriaceae bacterium]